MDNRLIARIARAGGARLLDLTVGSAFPDAAGSGKAGKRKRGLTGAIAGAALTRIATRSVPGAIIVGGGLLAKMLYDRRQEKARAAAKTGKAQAGSAADAGQ